MAVLPPQPEPDAAPPEVKFTAGDALAVVIEPTKVTTDRGPEHHFVVRGRLTGRYPLPHRTEVTVAVSDGTTKPFVLHIPVGVLPTNVTLLLWGLVSLFLPLFSFRFVKLVAETGSPFDTLAEMATDVRFLGQSLALTAGAALVLRLAGWVMLQLAPSGGEAE